MKNKLFFVVMIFTAFFFNNTFAATLKLYKKPDEKSKVSSTVKDSKGLTPILYNEDNKDWVKVVDPKNDKIGWIKIKDYKGPIVITKTDGSEVKQQVIVNDEDGNRSSSSYNVLQYSSDDVKKNIDPEKIKKEMKVYEKKMNETMRQMSEDMQKTFQDLSEIFRTMPVFQPKISFTELDGDKEKDGKGKSK